MKSPVIRVVKKAVVLAILASAVVAIPVVSQHATDVPKWEAASIKPCAPTGTGGRGAGPGGRLTFSPGRLTMTCTTVSRLIAQAYLTRPDGTRNPQIAMEGGPGWINSEQYEINAKAEGVPSEEIMRGPMLQALLEARFRLKVHSETRDVPVYALTVLKGGLKLQPLEDVSCDPRDSTKPPRPVLGTPEGYKEVLKPGQQPTCAWLAVSAGPGNVGTILHAKASNLTEFAGALRLVLDRPVINRTGIPGMFDFRMQFVNYQSPAGTALDSPGAPVSPPAVSDPAGPSIFTAIQDQLGLKLESTRGPGEFLVIDSVERPTEN
jgi:uncharacterized protein (TIGR03435 family)